MSKIRTLIKFFVVHTLQTLKQAKVEVIDDEIKLTPQEKMLKKWHEVNGNILYLVQHDLNANSIVWEAGGYLGNWTVEMAARYNPTIIVFEPMSQFYEQLHLRFRKNKKITLIQAGVWSRNETLLLNKDNDSSSVVRNGISGEKVKMIDIVEFARKHDFRSVDLFQINIEGAEYELLEYLVRTNLLKKIKRIQVQFHIDIANSAIRRRAIIRELNKTHKKTFSFPFVWEGWELRK